MKPNVQGMLYDNRKGIFALKPAADREVGDGRIHETVFERMEKVGDYKPKNVSVNTAGIPAATNSAGE